MRNRCEGCDCRRRRRRALADRAGVSYDRTLEESSWQMYKDTCKNFDYDLSLLVDSHLYLIAQPSAEGVAAGCMPLAFHSRTDLDGDAASTDADLVLEKQILKIEFAEKEDEEDQQIHAVVEAFAKQNGIGLGNHSFVDIARAYDTAEANAPGMKTHDMVKNNCGDFVKSFGGELGVKVTPEMTVSIAKKLLEHGDADLLDELRSSKYFALLLPILQKTGSVRGGVGNNNNHKKKKEDFSFEEDWNGEEIVTRLVEMRTGDLYGV